MEESLGILVLLFIGGTFGVAAERVLATRHVDKAVQGIKREFASFLTSCRARVEESADYAVRVTQAQEERHEGRLIKLQLELNEHLRSLHGKIVDDD